MDIEFRPQPGPQEKFLKSSADIAIYGGAAGSGKSFSLLLEPLYHTANAQFRTTIFRRTIPQIRLQGGLWDTSQQIFPMLKAEANETSLTWRFPSGAQIKFAGLEHEADVYGYQGAQLSLAAFDELSQFTSIQFWYLFSRLRSMSGIRPYVRATTNPDPDSWVRQFIGWWINQDTGLAIPERSGVLRWFVRIGDELVWADTKQELVQKFGADAEPKSATFISANVFDNKILLEQDPGYLANLKSLPLLDRERLLNGNWNIRATGGNFFRREWFGTPLDTAPTDIIARCRFWDRAASEQRIGTDPDSTCSVLLGKTRQGLYVVEDCVRIFATPHAVEQEMVKCAQRDGVQVTIGFMCDPGSAGKYESGAASRALDGYVIKIIPASGAGNKETRARPISSQCESGNVKLVRGLWNDDFLKELENFPSGRHDDAIDGLSGAHQVLTEQSGGWTAEAVREVLASNPQLNQAHNLDRATARAPYRINQPGGQFHAPPNLSRMGRWTPRR